MSKKRLNEIRKGSLVVMLSILIVFCVSALVTISTIEAQTARSMKDCLPNISYRLDETFTVTELEPDLLSIENDRFITTATERIASINSSTPEEACELVNTILEKAKEYGISKEMAFTLVHVESDFYTSANSRADAIGLCQVTAPCLADYNNYHPTNQYNMSDMKTVNKNLDVGFWYFKHIIDHYTNNGCYDTSNSENLMKDVYIAYNIGVTAFSSVGVSGRNSFRSGYYPKAMYGAKAGDPYGPVKRFNAKYGEWKPENNS